MVWILRTYSKKTKSTWGEHESLTAWYWLRGWKCCLKMTIFTQTISISSMKQHFLQLVYKKIIKSWQEKKNPHFNIFPFLFNTNYERFLMLKRLLSRKVLVFTTQKFLLASVSIQKSKILSVIGWSIFKYELPKIVWRIGRLQYKTNFMIRPKYLIFYKQQWKKPNLIMLHK